MTPDSEPTEAVAYFRADEAMINDLDAADAGIATQHYAADIVRAYLARPAIARPAPATTRHADAPSAIVDRTMRRLSAPDLSAVGQHADLVRSLRGHDGPADAGNASTIAVLRALAVEIEAFRQQPIEDGEDPTRAAGAAAALDMVNARIRAAERLGDHQVATNESAS